MKKLRYIFVGLKLCIFVGDLGIFYDYFMEKLLNQKDHTLGILKLRKLESLKGYG